MSCDSASLSLAASWLRSAREVVVFTGAGVSAESGIPTFRDDEGFWQHFPVEEFATWRGLVRTAVRRPRRLADFIHAMLHPIAAAKPNAGHRAISEMEKHVGVTVVTQNIDMLPSEAKAAGAKVITIDPSGGNGDAWLKGTAATMLPQLVETAFDQHDNE